MGNKARIITILAVQAAVVGAITTSASFAYFSSSSTNVISVSGGYIQLINQRYRFLYASHLVGEVRASIGLSDGATFIPQSQDAETGFRFGEATLTNEYLFLDGLSVGDEVVYEYEYHNASTVNMKFRLGYFESQEYLGGFIEAQISEDNISFVDINDAPSDYSSVFTPEQTGIAVTYFVRVRVLSDLGDPYRFYIYPNAVYGNAPDN